MSPIRGALSGALALLGLIIWTYNGQLLIQAIAMDEREEDAGASVRDPNYRAEYLQSLTPRSIDLGSDERDPFAPMSAGRAAIPTPVQSAEPRPVVGTVSKGPGLELIGILRSVNGPVATLLNQNGAVSHVSLGARIEDLTVDLITTDSVVLQRGKVSYELKMGLIAADVMQAEVFRP